MNGLKAVVAAIAFGGAMLLGTGSATAHNKVFPMLDMGALVGPELPNGDTPIFGFVAASDPRCRANRPVSLTFVFPGGERRVVDRARTSRNGLYGLAGELGDAETAIVRAPRIRIAPKTKRHRHFCQAGRITLS